jgi:uncharacterized protein
MAEPTDRHDLEVLPLAQCLTLLRSRPLGRLAYIDAGHPVVVPMNHLVDGSTVVVRSLGGSKLDAVLRDKPVSFQLDDYDATRGTGWSVLVQGKAIVLDEEDRIERYEQELDSWAISDDSDVTWLRIRADEISGRRLRRVS